MIASQKTNQTVQCALGASVAHTGDTTKVILKFGPVELGRAIFNGRWAEDQVLRDLRLNGAKRYLLNDTGMTVLKAQGIKL